MSFITDNLVGIKSNIKNVATLLIRKENEITLRLPTYSFTAQENIMKILKGASLQKIC